MTDRAESVKRLREAKDLIGLACSRYQRNSPGALKAEEQALKEIDSVIDALANAEPAGEQWLINVKALDVALNGPGGAERPLLIDVLSQVEQLARKLGHPVLAGSPTPSAEPVAEVFDTFGNTQDPTKCVGHVWLASGYFPPRGTKLYAAPPSPAAQQAPSAERWVVVRETVLDIGLGDDVRTGGKPELGYAVIAHATTYATEDAARAAHKAANLPLGWVLLPLSRFLPDLTQQAAPAAPEVREASFRALVQRLRGGGWDLRSPQEMADMIADMIEAALAPPIAAPEQGER